MKEAPSSKPSTLAPEMNFTKHLMSIKIIFRENHQNEFLAVLCTNWYHKISP